MAVKLQCYLNSKVILFFIVPNILLSGLKN